MDGCVAARVRRGDGDGVVHRHAVWESPLVGLSDVRPDHCSLCSRLCAGCPGPFSGVSPGWRSDRCPRPARHRRMEFAAFPWFFQCGICDSIYRDLLVVAFAGIVLGLGFNAFAGSRTMFLRQYSGLGGAHMFDGDHYAESTFVGEGAGLSDLMVELCGGRSSAETPRTEEEQHNLTWHFLLTRETWWGVFAVALLLCGISFATSSMIALVVGLLVTCALVGFVLVAIARNATSFGVPRAIMWRKNSVLALGQAVWIAVLFIITAVSIAS